MAAERRAPDRELLLANHRFPGSYTIKAFGPADDAFRAGVLAAFTVRVDPSRVRLSERATRSGSKICITGILMADHVDEVIAAYERLYDVPGLSLVL